MTTQQLENYTAFGAQDNFQEGWAIIPFNDKPHYYLDNTASTENKTGIEFKPGCRFFVSLCGHAKAATHPGKPAVVPGNFPKCQHCLRLAERHH